MPAIIIKRDGNGGNRRSAFSLGDTSINDLVVVVIKENQIEVYTDQEAQDKLAEEA